MALFGFRTGAVIGGAGGYVVVAKAGRERYEQIVALWNRVREDKRVDAIIEQAAALTEAPRDRAREALGDGLRAASDAVEDRTGSN